MEEAHLLPAADVLRRFSVTAEGGLSPEQVTSARERHGPNGERAARPAGRVPARPRGPVLRLRPCLRAAGSEGSGSLCGCSGRRSCAATFAGAGAGSALRTGRVLAPPSPAP